MVEHGADGAAVRDEQHPLPRVADGEFLQRLADARPELPARLAAGESQRRVVPAVEERQVRELCGGLVPEKPLALSEAPFL